MKSNSMIFVRTFAFLLTLAIFSSVCSASVIDTSSVISKAPVKIEPINAPFSMSQLERPVFPDKTFNIKDFGTVEGGSVKNTEAIKKTIEASAKAGVLKIVEKK